MKRGNDCVRERVLERIMEMLWFEGQSVNNQTNRVFDEKCFQVFWWGPWSCSRILRLPWSRVASRDVGRVMMKKLTLFLTSLA